MEAMRATVEELPNGEVFCTLFDTDGELIAAGVTQPATGCTTCQRLIARDEYCFGANGQVYCRDCGWPC